MTVHTLGRRPVCASSPQGKEVRYDDLFVSLETEINKLSSPSDRQHFSWQTVADLGASVLRDHSKDLLAASYLSVALVHLNQGEGLDAASMIFKDLIDQYWDSLYPVKKRSQGRIAALTWWVDRTERALDQTPEWVLKPDQAKKITDRMQAIDQFLGDNLDGAPSLIGLIRKIKSRQGRSEVPKTTPKQPVEPAEKTQTPPNDSPSEAMDISTDNPDEAVKILGPLFQKIKQTSRLLRTDQDHTPQPYRWLRFSIWDSVRVLPLSTDGVTRIAPPSAQILNHLEHLLKNDDFKALVKASEAALYNPSHLFVFKLNYYSWTALAGLGNRYRKARDTVLMETQSVLDRLDGLDRLLFSNGTPFVCETTRTWLESHNLTSDSDAMAIDSHDGPRDDRLEEEIRSIRERLKKNKNLPEAVKALELAIRHCQSKKDAMRLRLAFARILASEKQEKMAAAHLEAVLEQLDRHNMDDWDPDFSLSALNLMFKVFRKLGEPRYRLKADDVYIRIVKLSTGHAMTL